MPRKTSETTETTTTAKKTTAKKTAKTAGGRCYYELHAKVTFVSPLLGTNPNDAEIYSRYIAGLAEEDRKEAELERLGVEELDERGMTVFLRDPEDNSVPLLKQYTWKGFLKSRASALAKIPGSHCSTLKAFIKEIDNLISMGTEFEKLVLPEDEGIEIMERPLRAQVNMKEISALAKSEVVPKGTTTEVVFRCERIEGIKMVLEALDFGEQQGTGQWRNAGYGRFEWEEISLDVKPYVSKHQDSWDKLAGLAKKKAEMEASLAADSEE